MDLDTEIKQQVEELVGKTNGAARPNGGHAIVTPRVEADPDRYDFAKLGETIATSLVQVAQSHAQEANVLLEQVQQFADDIRNKITEKSLELTAMNERLKTFGDSLLEAHRKFITEQTSDSPK